MYQSYDLSRYIDGDLSKSTSITVSDDDAINCAHMLAAGFNAISRNMMGDFVLGVVDTKAGTVQYDGKVEQIKRAEPWSYEQTFTFEPSEGDADTILTLFGNGETPTFTAAGKMIVEDQEPQLSVETVDIGPECFATKDGRVLCWRGQNYTRQMEYAPEVYEAAYAELEAVKEVLFDAGVETIPATAGVQALTGRLEHERHARQNMETQYVQANESARAELIRLVSGAYTKLQRIDKDGNRADLQARFRGMLDVLAGFLVATDEADYDERHAVARRLAGVDDVEA